MSVRIKNLQQTNSLHNFYVAVDSEADGTKKYPIERISDEINGLDNDITALQQDIGDLDDLQTTIKNNLVVAINEAAESGGATPYTSNPTMNGVASPGVSDNYSRGDHVHPSDTSKADTDIIADAYSALSTYAVGDYVMYNGSLYKCNTDISTAEAWTAAHWTQVIVMDELGGGGSAHGIPSDGTTGQVLKKASNTDYDAEWGSGGSAITSVSVSLAVADWSNNEQTVSVTGVTASNTVIVSPAPSSIDDYTDAGIYCSAQASGTLTFTCETVPSSAISVNVMIVG